MIIAANTTLARISEPAQARYFVPEKWLFIRPTAIAVAETLQRVFPISSVIITRWRSDTSLRIVEAFLSPSPSNFFSLNGEIDERAVSSEENRAENNMKITNNRPDIPSSIGFYPLFTPFLKPFLLKVP